MKREILITKDGSTTIHLPEWNEQYHSTHGAIQEAFHVFIDKGLDYFTRLYNPKHISILEIGFGTGLNTFITLLESEKRKIEIEYVAVEAYPVTSKEIEMLNYPEQLQVSYKSKLFRKIHEVSWEKSQDIISGFHLLKQKKYFSEINSNDAFDIIYFDAFGARVQPELWTESIFQLMYNALKTNGVLVTYSAKGSVKRAMLSVGFKVEKLDGPLGKRHMLRAVK